MNVKPGDLARIVDNDCTANLQAIVSVERPCQCPDKPFGWWICKAMQSLVAKTPIPYFGVLELRVPAGTEVHLHDSALRPLPGDDQSDEEPRVTSKPQEPVAA